LYGGWIAGWPDRWMVVWLEWLDGWGLDGLIVGWLDGLMAGWVDGWMVGWFYGWKMAGLLDG